MAKGLTAMANPNMVKLNNSGTTELSTKIPLSKLEFRDDFKNMFPLNETAAQNYAEEMTKNGYDNSQPIHLWFFSDEEGLHHIVIDGHTRVKAAQIAGLYDIPCFKHEFNSMLEAKIYALNLQLSRRNLSDIEKIQAVELMDSLRVENGDAVKGKTSEKLAQQLGISSRQVEKIRSVTKDADEETMEQIASGEKSINQVYNEKHPPKQKPKESVLLSTFTGEETTETDFEDEPSSVYSSDNEVFSDKVNFPSEPSSSDDSDLNAFSEMEDSFESIDTELDVTSESEKTDEKLYSMHEITLALTRINLTENKILKVKNLLENGVME